MNIQFQYPLFVAVFAIVFVMLLFYLQHISWKKKLRKKMGDQHLIAELTKAYSPKKYLLKFVLFLIAFSLGIIAIMNPRRPGEKENIRRKGIDIVIAMDVSNSMLATDLPPSRLERARQFASKLIDNMPNDRIALVLFAGKAYLQMPLTLDHRAARLFVSTASSKALPQQGTVISDALSMAANAFNPSDQRYKTIILITDGEEHEEAALIEAKAIANEGIMVNTIGIGDPAGANFIDPATGANKVDEMGNIVVTQLNEQLLQEIAATTHGSYQRLAESDEAVETVSRQLSQIEGKAINDISQVNFKTYYQWLVAGMLLLLLIELFISELKKTRLIKKKIIHEAA